MDNSSLAELLDMIRAIVRGDPVDPLAKYLREQMEIVLHALEGWESLAGLIHGSEP